MAVRWPWESRKKRIPRNFVSISDPRVGPYLGVPESFAGVELTEHTALGLSAVWRAVALISGTIAQLPLRTLRDLDGGATERMKSIFDRPGGDDGPTRFEWVETVLLHLLLHGNAYLRHRYQGSGALYSLEPIHPLYVEVELPRLDDDVQPKGGKWFVVVDMNGHRERLDANHMTHIPAMCTDGIKGLSPIAVARTSLGNAVASDRAAAKMVSTGATISGIVTADDEVGLEADEVAEIKRQLDNATTGYENAGQMAVVNRKLKFTPWTMTAADAQFLQSRQFSIEEVARWFGVPPHLLMQTEKQTSWGTGIGEQNTGLARYVLAPWTARLEQRLSRLLPNPRYVEFDFAGLERPDFKTEIELLLAQVAAGFLTMDEARSIRNLPPLPATAQPAAPAADPTPPDQGGSDAQSQ